jgi:hypothetical protein
MLFEFILTQATVALQPRLKWIEIRCDVKLAKELADRLV